MFSIYNKIIHDRIRIIRRRLQYVYDVQHNCIIIHTIVGGQMSLGMQDLTRGQDDLLKLWRKDRLNLWKDYSEDLLNKENPWTCTLEHWRRDQKDLFRPSNLKWNKR